MSLYTVVLPRSVRRTMVEHARRERPLECCGLLVGKDARVDEAIPMRNVANSPTRFRLDDREHIDLRRVVRQRVPPQAIIGVYHSHPAGPPTPSPLDVAEAYYPEWIYVIVGFRHERARVRGFSIKDGQVRPVGFVLTAGPHG